MVTAIKNTLFTLFFLAASIALTPGGKCKPGKSETITSKKLKKNLSKSMTTFSSNHDFDDYIEELSKKLKEMENDQSKYAKKSGLSAQTASAAPGSELAGALDESESDDSSITNNQEQGVDEGDIVKAYKDYLVVLRRGRIFTVLLEDKNEPVLKPISRVDAYPKDFTQGTWYDEMLIYKNRIVVVGYSYGMNATEIGLFTISKNGHVHHNDTYFLDSNDYYSSRNYASRLVNNQLIFYMPYYLYTWNYHGGDYDRKAKLPQIRKWIKGNETTKGKEILAKTDIYKPVQATLHPTLHTITKCDLDAIELSCKSKAVLGPYSRSFYVSSNAIYVWVSGEYEYWYNQQSPDLDDDKKKKKEPKSFVYMILIDDESARAIRAHGTPIDQFSFKEDTSGHLNVLVRDAGYGDAMWNPEVTSGGLALLRTSLKNFSNEPRAIPMTDYIPLPAPKGYILQNRFVGDHLLYGSGNGWYNDPNSEKRVYIKNYRKQSENLQEIELTHGVDRIEVMGSGAVVLGGNGKDLEFSSLELGSESELKNTYTLENAMQGELRSHGFFYKGTKKGEGVLGLPVRRQGAAYHHLYYGSAEILFLKVSKDMEFSNLGSLAAKPKNNVNDACMASCVDWYGNARPIFYQGRVFALMGYELVEGDIGKNEISEIDRQHFFVKAEQ